MKNVLLLLKRDFKRLIKAPAALVVVIVLVLLPSLYTWFNVAGFWNPYDHTGNMRVCVVNEDSGSSSDLTGSLNMGNEIVEELSQNTQLGWVFTDRDQALEEVRSGKAYAAFIIPSDFSSDTLTLLTGDFQQPTLQYYVNEKVGGVSTKVTDSGANSLDQTINDSFVSVVSKTLATQFDEALQQSNGKLNEAQSGIVAKLGQVQSSLEGVQSSVEDLQTAAGDASAKAQDAKGLLQQAKEDTNTLQTELDDSSQLLTSTQKALGPFTTSFMDTFDKSSALASQAVAHTNDAIGSVSGALSSAEGGVSGAVDQGKALVDLNKSVIEGLTTLSESLPEGADKDALLQSIESLQAQNDSLNTAVEGLESSYPSIKQAASDVSQASDDISQALQGVLGAHDDYRATLVSTTFPALNTTASDLSNTLLDLSTAVGTQTVLIDKGIAELDQLSATLDQTAGTLSDTVALLEGFSGDIESVKTDVAALSTSNALEELLGEEGIDPNKVSDFMFSPAKIDTVSLYSVNSYGSAMAPLFMNLTLWIGVFMLLVILRQEVDREGIPQLTARQSYGGRLLFLAVFAALQAIVCCSGNLVLGVEVASIPLFYLTSVVASLTYLCIQYGLAVLLQHVGKGLCVILIFVQIPGATGLYPIEMTPEFFQGIYPLFPFTYGINALRETIAGFYGMQWLQYMGVLFLFLVLFLLLGLVLRPYFVNLNRMVASQIKKSDLINGEEAELPARRYRSSLLLEALANQKDFRQAILHRFEEYKRRYEKGKRFVLALALLIPVFATVLMTLFAVEKVVILTTWLVWLILVLLFIISVEFIRDRLEHEVALSAYSNTEIHEMYDAGATVKRYGTGVSTKHYGAGTLPKQHDSGASSQKDDAGTSEKQHDATASTKQRGDNE